MRLLFYKKLVICKHNAHIEEQFKILFLNILQIELIIQSSKMVANSITDFQLDYLNRQLLPSIIRGSLLATR